MVRVSSLQEAVCLVEDGERVVLSVDGKDVALISVDELHLIEAREDRLDVEAVNEAHAEPEDCITLDEYMKKRAARSRRKAKHEKAVR